MDSYLMMIYVTMEQEAALKTFFLDNGWAFCKPDLSYTTDKIGPAAGTFANVARNEDFLSNPNSSKHHYCLTAEKHQVPTPPLASTPQTTRSKMILNQAVNTLNKANEKVRKEQLKDKAMSPVTVQDIDENSKAIKVEVTDHDDDYDPSGKYLHKTGDDMAINDEYNDDTDEEDSYGQGGNMLGDTHTSGSSHVDSSVDVDGDDSGSPGKKQKLDMSTNLSNDFGHKYYSSEQEFILKQGLNWTCGFKPAIKCTFCHKTFTSLSARKRHEKTVHAMEKKFQCDHCDEKFGYKWLMEAHAAKKHGIGKLFNCACGQTFNRQSNLTQHATICKEVQGPGNETVCKVCTKRFKCKKYLDVHMKFQHDITTQPSVCNICGESFTRPWSLTRHLKRTHAIVEPSNKETDSSTVTNMSGKAVESDSDAEISNKTEEQNTQKAIYSSKRKCSGSRSNSINANMQSEKTSLSADKKVSKSQKESLADTDKEFKSNLDFDKDMKIDND